MTVLTDLPEHLLRALPVAEQRAILGLGVTFRRVGWEERLRQAKVHVREKESRYGCPLAELEAHGLPADADVAFHEDYVEWHYWESVRQEALRTLEALQQIAQVTTAG